MVLTCAPIKLQAFSINAGTFSVLTDAPFYNVGVPDACRAIPCLLFILPFSGWILWGSWEAKCPSHTLSCGLFIFFSLGATYVSINLFAYYLSMYFLSLSSEVGTIGTDLP